jgi:hypothetical protein
MKTGKNRRSCSVNRPALDGTLMIVASVAFVCINAAAQASWPTHAHDAQHTSVSAVASQPLSKIHWSTPVDLHPVINSGDILIHYGSPLITAANTVIVPVKTGTNSFRVEAHDGATGALKWFANTDYQVPSGPLFIPGFGPTLSGNKLFIPAAGGTVVVKANADQSTGGLSRRAFYGIKNFQGNKLVYTQNVQINTPITADANGNVFFGFLVVGTTPIGLQSGLARIAANGTAVFVAATTVSNDSSITKVAMNCAPALSPDGKTLYVTVGSIDSGFGYLLALDSTTLQLIRQVRLTDPATGLDADITDNSSAAPTVGPDGDVYFGVLENPFPGHNDRGWLLHFNSDLSQEKTPGSFGWDDTASIVDASLVASYKGKSTYLLMTKYNNYAGIGTGNGKNKIAILDPNAQEIDPVDHKTKVMKEVMTILGRTRDPDATGFPGAVREWCINTAAVDPVGKSVLANSEDGKLYRWDLTTKTFSQVIKLTGGIGEAYTPTVIGSDGTVYAINDAILFAVGQ